MQNSLMFFKVILVVVSVILTILGRLLYKSFFKAYTPEELQTKMAPRIYMSCFIILWGIILIGAVLHFRDYL